MNLIIRDLIKNFYFESILINSIKHKIFDLSLLTHFI
nr:MAG TPA: hypothetical protein [Bacteriophage sp.]